MCGSKKENMNNRGPFINTYFFAAALIISCCFVWGCENDDKVLKEMLQNVAQVEEVKKIQIYFSEEGKMKSIIKAPLMYRVQPSSQLDTQYVEFPKTLHADFYNDSTKIESWIDALYGKYFEVLNKVYLRDSVVVISIKGDTLRCHDLWWDQGRGLFYTDNAATYRSPGNDITGGKGMEATQDFKSVTFKYPLGTVKIAESGFAE
jgi:LPS export ABC transporter protein LptC